MKTIIGADFWRKFLGLCLPPFILAVADGTLTVLGQSEAYWSNFHAVNEASPGFGALLKINPWLLAVGAGVWLAAFCAMIIAAPPTAALILSLAITLAHTFGSSSWLFEHFMFGSGYQIANAYYLFSACLIGFGVRYAFPSGVMKSDNALNLSDKTRLQVVGGIFLAASVMFLMPLPR
jgi:glycerol-3-phosphate acyltransferase PlsY